MTKTEKKSISARINGRKVGRPKNEVSEPKSTQKQKESIEEYFERCVNEDTDVSAYGYDDNN